MNYIYAIVLSGGTGTRMQSDLPKQFLEFGGKSLLYRSVEAFKEWGLCRSIVVVANEYYMEKTESILGQILEERDRIVVGGESRHASFLNGLGALPLSENDIVLIHDAARPFFSSMELELLVYNALKFGASTLAEKTAETLVSSESRMVSSLINRDKVYNMKTPQCFHTSILKTLISQNLEQEPTDLCSWILPIGVRPVLVDSNPYNIKITKPEDLEIASAYESLFLGWKEKNRE